MSVGRGLASAHMATLLPDHLAFRVALVREGGVERGVVLATLSEQGSQFDVSQVASNDHNPAAFASGCITGTGSPDTFVALRLPSFPPLHATLASRFEKNTPPEFWTNEEWIATTRGTLTQVQAALQEEIVRGVKCMFDVGQDREAARLLQLCEEYCCVERMLHGVGTAQPPRLTVPIPLQDSVITGLALQPLQRGDAVSMYLFCQ